MKLLIFLSILSVTSGEKKKGILYKRITLDETQWPGLISKTVPFKTNGNIECGAICASENCDLYAPQKETKSCHIGYFKDKENDYLTGQEGIQSVYISPSMYFFQLLYLDKDYYAPSNLHPHHGKGVLGNVYLLALGNSKR